MVNNRCPNIAFNFHLKVPQKAPHQLLRIRVVLNERAPSQSAAHFASVNNIIPLIKLCLVTKPFNALTMQHDQMRAIQLRNATERSTSSMTVTSAQNDDARTRRGNRPGFTVCLEIALRSTEIWNAQVNMYTISLICVASKSTNARRGADRQSLDRLRAIVYAEATQLTSARKNFIAVVGRWKRCYFVIDLDGGGKWLINSERKAPVVLLKVLALLGTRLECAFDPPAAAMCQCWMMDGFLKQTLLDTRFRSIPFRVSFPVYCSFFLIIGR